MAGKGGDTPSALGLLALRLGAGGFLIYGHGWPKLVHFAERAHKFADPLHVGSPLSLAMSVFAEVVCAGCVLLGDGAKNVGKRTVPALAEGLLGDYEPNFAFGVEEIDIIYLARSTGGYGDLLGGYVKVVGQALL